MFIMIRSRFKKYLLTTLLSAIVIVPVMGQSSKTQAVFTLTISNRAVQQDSVFRKEMLSAIKNRLKKVYPLQADDLVQKGDQLELRLTGKVDTALVKRILNKKVDLNFYSGYKDALKVISVLKTKDTQKILSFPPAELTKSLTYLATLQSKDTIAVRKLTRSVVLPAGLKWFPVPKPENITELYLLNTAQPIITGDQLRHAGAYFLEQGQPSGTTSTYANVLQVMIVLNEPGRMKFADYTREHVMEMMAIVTGDELIMAAILTSEINEGSMLINSGNVELSNQLLDKIGYPFPATVRVTKCIMD